MINGMTLKELDIPSALYFFEDDLSNFFEE